MKPTHEMNLNEFERHVDKITQALTGEQDGLTLVLEELGIEEI